ncbi:hypothetical protein ACJX0J_032297, partial [Zea mays]
LFSVEVSIIKFHPLAAAQIGQFKIKKIAKYIGKRSTNVIQELKGLFSVAIIAFR